MLKVKSKQKIKKKINKRRTIKKAAGMGKANHTDGYTKTYNSWDLTPHGISVFGQTGNNLIQKMFFDPSQPSIEFWILEFGPFRALVEIAL